MSIFFAERGNYLLIMFCPKKDAPPSSSCTPLIKKGKLQVFSGNWVPVVVSFLFMET
jgi:hypothetical protein